MLTYHSISVLLFFLAASTPAESDIKEILVQVEKHPLLFDSFDYKYVIEGHASRRYSETAADVVLRSTTYVHYVRQGGRFRVHLTDTSYKADGRVESFQILTAFDGNVTRQLIDNRLLQVHDTPTDFGALVFGPGKIGWARLAGNDRELFQYLRPDGLPVAKDIRVDISCNGVAEINGVRCVIVERRLQPQRGEENVYLIRFFLAPRFYFLVVKSEVIVEQPGGKTFPESICETSDWRQVVPGVWIPFVSTTRFYSYPNESDEFFVISEHVYRVLDVSLNPQFPKSFFSNIPLPKDGAIETYRGGRLVSRRVVGNPRDPEEAKSGLPPWVWLLGNVVLVALLLGVYLRYRTPRTSKQQTPETISSGHDISPEKESP